METILQEQRRLKKRFDAIETAGKELKKPREASKEVLHMALPESIQLPADSFKKLQEIDKELDNEFIFKTMVRFMV